LIFSGRYPKNLFDNQFTFEELIPNALVYHNLPDKFKLPENLEKILLEVRKRVSAYIDTEGISDNDYRNLIRMNFVKQWEVFKKDPSFIDCYMDAQLGMLYMWARVENKTIVKNIIERTQDELAQEFLSKNDEYGK
jgi:superfamily I DNA and/or RNA helicase